MSIELTFTQDKETKGTFRFAEDAGQNGGDRPTIGTIYLVKDAAAALGNPTRIKVTVEAES